MEPIIRVIRDKMWIDLRLDNKIKFIQNIKQVKITECLMKLCV